VAQEAAAVAATPPRRRTRKYRKRTKFQHVPKMAYPVKALWDAASDEEQKQAHLQCTALLELWLGKATKEEVMERLQLPALRLWQMSQQALSGMVAGLLRQPKWRLPKGVTLMPDPQSDVVTLRRRNAELEKELLGVKAVLALLRELPGNRERVAASRTRTRGDQVAKGTTDPEPANPSPSEPAAATTKTAPPTTPRRRAKTDRGSAAERGSPEG